jgi:serine/threonine protein kinase
VVLKRLGRGGMGVVYLAYDQELDRRVALKLLQSQLSGVGSDGTQRLLREAQAMAKLSHPNVVPIFDVGTVEDQVFLAMEYIDGVTLREWQKSEVRSVREVLTTYVQAGRGLEAAHAAGILHRDFKPDNVIVDGKGRARVLDFGVARFDESVALPDELALATTGVVTPPASQAPLTFVGTLVGTPQYMAPEQLRGDRAEARSDQFAFCVALYEALYKERPFDGKTPREMLDAIARAPARRRPTRRVQRGVRLALARGLSERADRRWPALGDLLEAIERDLDRRRRVGLLAAMLVPVLALTTALVLARTRPSQAAACSGLDAEIHGIWGAPQRDRVVAAFAALHDPRATGTGARVVSLLDDYAARWTTMRVESCQATRVRFQQSDEAFDLRTRCLDQARGALSTAVSLLASADGKLVDHAVDLAGGLPEIARCADVAHLRAPFAIPHDPAQRARVESVRARTTDADLLARAFHLDEADQLASPALSDARDLRNPQLEGAALAVTGDVLLKRGRFAEARPILLDATMKANAARDDFTEGLALTELFFVAGSVPPTSPRAEVDLYERLAQSAVQRAGDPDALRGMLQHNRALVHTARGELGEAESEYRDAMVLRERAGRLGAAANSKTELAMLLMERGREREALALFQAAATTLASEYTPENPRLGDVLVHLAGCYLDLGDAVSARDATERAEPIVARMGVDALGWVRLYRAAADELANGGTAGFDAASSALGLLVQADDPTQGHLEWGNLLLRRRHPLEAESHAKAAMAADDQAARFAATALHVLASVRRGGVHQVSAEARSLEARLDDAHAKDDLSRLVPLLAVGEAALATGAPERARIALERASTIAAATDGGREYAADVHLALARALHAKDPERVRSLAAEARSEYEEARLPEQAKLAAQLAAAPGHQ